MNNSTAFIWLTVLCCLAALSSRVSCSTVAVNATRSHEQLVTKLIADLIKNYGAMGKHVQPYNDRFSAFQVNMSFHILHFYGLNENEILEIGVWCSFLWTDSRLTWDSSKSGGLHVIKVPASSIWLPDVGLSNTKSESQSDFRFMKPLEVQVYPNGSVYLYYHVVTQVACPMDVTYFPFDTQTCRFQFGPWTSYRGSYKIHLPPRKVRMANISKSVSEWNLVEFGVVSREYYDANVDQFWDYFDVYVKLRRRPYYYIFVIVVPFFMLSIIACLIFLAQGPGEMINLAIAILLTMTIYIMITSSSAPKSMQTVPLIGIYIIAQMASLSLFTFVATKNYKTHSSLNEAQQVDTGTTSRCVSLNKLHNILLMYLYLALTVINVFICMVVIPFSV